MRRALAILKDVPAVLCGLLVVAWGVSFYFQLGRTIRWTNSSNKVHSAGMWIEDGNIMLFWLVEYDESPHWIADSLVHEPRSSHARWWLGSFRFDLSSWGINGRLPVPAILTMSLPVVIGCLTRFRFPLWSYFAWTALVAAELAYYLR
jgi:hypothetical protein